MSLDFKSESLNDFLANVVQLVNQHSQRINTLEIDKIACEDVRKGNVTLANSSKLNPVFGKEIALENAGKSETFSESVTGLGSNLTNHANGKTMFMQLCSFCFRATRRPTRRWTASLIYWTVFRQNKTSRSFSGRISRPAKNIQRTNAIKFLTGLKI